MRYRELLRESGTPTHTVVYHGSDTHLTGFDLGRVKNRDETAIFFTDTPEEAAEFGRYVYEVVLDTAGFLTVDYGRYDRAVYGRDADGVYAPEVMKVILQKGTGHPGIVVEGVRNFYGGVVTNTYAVLDLSVILRIGTPHDTVEDAED